jgi:ribonuclease HI
MLAARSVTKQGFLEPASAEAQAVLLAIQLCQASGVQKIIVEGDAQAREQIRAYYRRYKSFAALLHRMACPACTKIGELSSP